ncbi:nucleotide-diphospho-sugar transferase [Zalerion maritima]|uniref:Mannose-1-phosphate guanyltransferase n=1 Tax=Zalerion maritima TaxID=339359 RepID=A0AAD5RJG1_9PEZI|nr:nucleotide-diphospho-sugar transferase [Zalerion maritima]
MPHAVSMASPGFQAIILCGPGSSFSTFTANPDENPKALLPIANRPMVWYPLEFCYRSGITNITLICPPSTSTAITSALNTNPALTSLPFPRPSILAPKDLDYNTGTAELLRLPEVKSAISSDFVLLPCDLVCELAGENLLQTWMITAASLPSILGDDAHQPQPQSGGMGVWYDTKKVNLVKGEETDFVITTALSSMPGTGSKTSLAPHLRNLVYSMPTDSLKDLRVEEGGLPNRHALLRSYPRTRMLSTHRDAHIYILPKWVLDIVEENPLMESVGEDVIGWWAKAGWQHGLSGKLKMDKIFKPDGKEDGDAKNGEYNSADTYRTSSLRPPLPRNTVSTLQNGTDEGGDMTEPESYSVPPILAYVHPPNPTGPLIRRVDTSQLLLQVSLQLAKLPALDESTPGEASPFAHPKKLAYPEGVQQKTTIVQKDSLVAENVTVQEKAAINSSVVGANCQIKEGAKLLQCLLMDGVVVGRSCKLTRCVIGKRAVIGDGSVLTDVEVQENLMVERKTDEKDNRLMSSEGLEATEEDLQALDTAEGDVDLG